MNSRDPFVRQPAYLPQDRLRLAILLGPACEGDDAEGAAVVAAALDGDPGGDLRFAPQLQPLVVLRRVELNIHHAATVARGLVDQLGQRPVGVGADHHVDVRGLLQQPGTQPLGHAAAHTDQGVRAHLLDPVQFRDTAQHALLGVLADRAGVHQDDVGLFGRGDLGVAAGRQNALHELAVAHVHLATVGLDPVSLRHAQPNSFAAVARSPPFPSETIQACCSCGPPFFKLSHAGIFR